MFFESKRLIERAEGLEKLKDAIKEKYKTWIIHYSCESFITTHGMTPRVTSISVRNLESALTKSFSIHLQAQFEKLDIKSLTKTMYDRLEKNMLEEFYSFIEKHKDHKWLHWNMRDANFGFEAIGNRYRILGGKPFEVDDDRKYDLPRILGKIYTYAYENNQPNGRLLNLAARNSITIKQALPGAEEAKAFANGQYLVLHQSTLRKIDIMETIVDLVDKNLLKVNVNTRDIYGISIPGIIEMVKNNRVLLAI